MQITYLLGAGASAKALPIVSEIPDRLSEYRNDATALFYQYFIGNANTLSGDRKIIADKYFTHFIENVSWLIDEINPNKSVDQFAFTLYLNKLNSELDRLKSTISSFFILEQLAENFSSSFIFETNKYVLPRITKRNIDYRYDYFWTLLQKNSNNKLVRDKIRVLSWNYDSQLELSYQTYLNIESNHEYQIRNHIIKELQIHPNYLPQFTNSLNKDSFSITKLNGTAGYFKTNEGVFYGDGANIFGNKEVDFELVLRILEDAYHSSYQKLNNSARNFNTISFAWENENENNSIVSKAISRTEDTQVLVVIGYSFPDYNRLIDTKILQRMKGTLEKVYLQDIDSKIINEKKEILRDILGEKIKIEGKVVNNDRFFIPQEFHQVQLLQTN